MATPSMEVIGRVEAFFAKPSVAIVALSATLRGGELIYLKGHTTDFQQAVESMEVDHQPIREAQAGQTVGQKVAQRCRPHDVVYRLCGSAPASSPAA